MGEQISLREKRDRQSMGKKLIALTATIVISLLGTQLGAATFPGQPVQLIVPFGAGSGTDMVARAIQPYAEKTLGAPLIIGNVPGADSRLGMTKIFKAKPDGYTLGLHGFPAPIIHEYLFEVPYKALDFTFVYAWTMNPQLIYVAENRGWKSFDDFLQEARKRPLTLGIPGFGTVVHLLALGLQKHINVKFNFINYPGSAQGFAALAGNHIDANIGSDAAALGLVRAKKVRPILNWAHRPNPNHPDVPLSSKYNVPTIVMTRGVFGPPNMPPGQVRVLEKAFAKAATEPKLADWARETGTDLVALDAKQFRQEVENQQALVRDYKSLLKPN